ncbi:bifunctional epoxide hydrolase 2 [Phtheirospermum japonicum]|uniref:Bifunctional epoxide hydrolase 2 n=1 Tax=Phtheirospermum japonicum TaxID=374723 RepID=A0A830D024_9LAMI|nr:bifunctional epoxide hydrolase 2 [Phtheirospermum japonicum]
MEGEGISCNFINAEPYHIIPQPLFLPKPVFLFFLLLQKSAAFSAFSRNRPPSVVGEWHLGRQLGGSVESRSAAAGSPRATNGINIHVAEIGNGPAVLFLHGFPELWYTWRHQMLSLSARGYRTIDPDLRGYGDSEAPPCAFSYTAFHIIGDLVGLLDALGLDRVFLVAHDWGAVMAWYFCLIRPNRIRALVNMSVVFQPRNPKRKPVESMRAILGDDYYICRFQVLFCACFFFYFCLLQSCVWLIAKNGTYYCSR